MLHIFVHRKCNVQSHCTYWRKENFFTVLFVKSLGKHFRWEGALNAHFGKHFNKLHYGHLGPSYGVRRSSGGP